MRYGLMIALVLAWVGTGWGDVEFLTGLSGVEVVIESLKPEAEQDGLHESQLQTDVELRLRKAGIRVLSSEESRASPLTMVWVYVNVHALRYETSRYVYSVDVELQQGVILLRDSSKSVFGTTWSSGMLGVVGTNNMPTEVRKSVGDKVDELINDWLAANPVKR